MVPISRNDYRPLQMVALSLAARVGGADPLPYRVMNLVVHALTTVWVFVLGRRVLKQEAAALAASALFALHPAHVEAVVNPRNISELLPALLLTVILAAYARKPGPGPGRSAWLWSLYALALLTKETALILPFLLWGLAGLKKGWKQAWRITFPFWVLAAAAGAWKAVTLVSGGSPRPGALGEYPFEAARLFGIYARLLVFPFPLKTLYPFRVPVLWTGPAWFFPLAALAAGGILLARIRKSRPLLCWIGTALLLSLLPALSKVAQAGRTVAEQRLYLPSVFYCLLAAGIFVGAFRGLPRRRRKIAFLGAAAAGICLTLLGAQYLAAWRSEYHLWLRASILSPRAALAFNNLAIAYHARGREKDALDTLRETLRIDPDHCEAHNNFGVYYRKQGKWRQAIEHFQLSLRSDPRYHIAALNLAEVQIRLGQPAKAEETVRGVIADNPHVAEAYNALAIALENQGRVEEAADAYRHSAELNPEYAVPLRNLALLLQEEGDYQEALEATLEARRIQPAHPSGFSLLARLYVRKGDFPAARKVLEEGLALNPHDRGLRSQLLALPR